MSVGTEIQAVRTDLKDGVSEVRGVKDEAIAIAGDFGSLMKAELELVRAETREQIQLAVKGSTWGAVTLVTSLVLVTWVALTATFALSQAMDLWLAALIVTGVLLVVTVGAALTAKSRFQQISLVPRRTVQAVKEDVEWAKQRMNSKSRSNAGVTR